MRVIYSRIEEEFITVEEARDILFQIDKTTKEVDWSNYAELDIEDACEKLNQEDMFGCGTSYYVVEEGITKADLLKVIHG